MSRKTKRKINKVLRREKGFRPDRYFRRMFFRCNALVLFAPPGTGKIVSTPDEVREWFRTI